MADTPFRVEVVTVTGLTVASTFPVSLAMTAAFGYLEDEPDLRLGSSTDRVGLRTILVRLFGELLTEPRQVELLDDEGVVWLIPAERVLAVRIIDPERTPGPPRDEEVHHIGFQLRRPAVAGTPREAAPIEPARIDPLTPSGEVGMRPKGEVD